MPVSRVLMIHNYYQQGGGEHTVFENEVKLLKENGIEVFSFTRDNADLKKKPWKLFFLPFSTIWSFSSYRAVKRLIREKHIDLVHCHNTFPQISPSVYYAAWRCGVPVVQTIHNFRFVCPNGLCFREGKICEECLYSGLKKSIQYGCYRNSRIQTLPVALMLMIHRRLGTYRRLPSIFLTEFNKNKIAPLLGMREENIFVRGNVVEEQAMPTTVKSSNYFIYIGRLDDYKGVMWMLERFIQHPELQLAIFGNGKLYDKAKQIVAGCRNIQLYGEKKHEDVLQALSGAVALVFPSLLYEGFPMTIAESFSKGVPVLCSNIGNGAQLICETGGGVLCDPQDSHSFDEAVDYILKNRNVLSANAQQAAEQWGPESSWKALKSIYQEILQHGAAN